MKERKEGRGEHLFDIWLLFREQKRYAPNEYFQSQFPYSRIFFSPRKEERKVGSTVVHLTWNRKKNAG